MVSSNKSKYLENTSGSVALLRANDTGAGIRKTNSGCRFLDKSHHPWLTVTFIPLLSKILCTKARTSSLEQAYPI